MPMMRPVMAISEPKELIRLEKCMGKHSFILLVFMALSLVSCPLTNNETPAERKAYQVLYEINGTAATVNMLIVKESEIRERIDGVVLPWSYGFTGLNGDLVYISVDNYDLGTSVIITIKYDDILLDSDTAINFDRVVNVTAMGYLP